MTASADTREPAIDAPTHRPWAGPGPLAVFNAVPELVVVVAAGFGIPAMLLLLAGYFVVPVVLSLGVVASGALVALGWPVGRGVPAVANLSRESWWTLGAVVVAGGFFLVNAVYSAQNIYAGRDPGTYGVTGEWLAHQHSLRISTNPEVFGHVDGVTGASLGFYDDLTRPDTVYAQGNHLLPAFLGMASWIAGPQALFRTNALIGGLALLAVFGLLRRFTGGGFALVAVTGLAVSLPMIAFSRDTYTEPLALLFLFGGMSLLWMAIESRRAAHFLVAGLVLGSVALVRIDGYAALLAVIVVAVFALARAGTGERAEWATRIAALGAGLVPVASLGFLDVTWLSSGYYDLQRGRILALLAAAAVLVVVGVGVVALCWYTSLPRLFTGPRRAWWANAAGLAVVAVFVVLASRPLWMAAHRGKFSGNLVGLQRRLGLPEDGFRTYDEHSLWWIGWYYGWPVLVLGVAGLALLVRRVVRDADARLLGFAAMALALSALYLSRVSIHPDQIWAMRRFLPVVIPGLLGAAVYPLARLARSGRTARGAAVGLAVIVVAVPAAITHPMERVRTDVPRLAAIQETCAVLPAEAAVITLGPLGSYTQTLRSFCGVPTQYMTDPTPGALARVRTEAAAGGRVLYVVSTDARYVPFATGVTNPPPFFRAEVTEWEDRLMDVPQTTRSRLAELYIGPVDGRGTVTPVASG